jgi:parallel beta-helix repeat protein
MSFSRFLFVVAGLVFLSACGGGSGSNSGSISSLPLLGDLVDSNTAVDAVSENGVSGDLVGVTASAENAEIYNLSDNAEGRFTINSTTGVVSVADIEETLIDFESDESHTITIVATLGDTTEELTVVIVILDETFVTGGDYDETIWLTAGDDLAEKLQNILITASPESIIGIPAGTYNFTSEISTSLDRIIIRGTGMGASPIISSVSSKQIVSQKQSTGTPSSTVLKFDDQITGSQGFLITGNNVTVEDLAIENTPGDSIKFKGSDGVTIRRVRIEWTNGPDEDNGAYGLYPVQTSNVLIEDSEVRGASDAGVYVGQSRNIIVRRNFVYQNVAGIEIENSVYADVYENETTLNTGGILVFDLPGPPVQGGEQTRVFNNKVYNNNTANFAPDGNIVGLVPAGTGIMIMANDDIEVFENNITDNDSAAIIVVSYYVNDVGVSKTTYDPVPEKIYIHDNVVSGNATQGDALAAQIGGVFPDDESVDPPKTMVDFFYDSAGVGDGFENLLKSFPAGLPESRRICFQNNGDETTFGTLNTAILEGIGGLNSSTDITAFDCSHASLPAIVLDEVEALDGPGELDNLALCNASGDSINAQAYTADCPTLSDYRLFSNASEPREKPSNGIIYDLTTPLFTDYANKYRFVFVPEGMAAAYRESDSDPIDFPIGTIIAKTFTIQSDLRDENSAEELIESRLLIRRSEGWVALPYIWNDAKTDAVLTVGGGSKAISWIDSSGATQMTNYSIPNTNNCANCHGETTMQPIGPKARLLNKDYDYGSGAVNQLEHWASEGILTGVPADTSTIVTIPDYTDTGADLDGRARGYLDINCAHCHSESGAADTSGLYLDYPRVFGTDTGECKPPVAAGDGSGGLDYDIVPGDAANSIMVYRMDSNELDVRMPEIGRSVIHTEGVDLITEWINAMTTDPCI